MRASHCECGFARCAWGAVAFLRMSSKIGAAFLIACVFAAICMFLFWKPASPVTVQTQEERLAAAKAPAEAVAIVRPDFLQR